MTAAPTDPLHDDALSAEERAMADALARLDASAGPSAALDARILAAARAASPVASSAPRGATSMRRRRWPNALGAAAVLVAAVGLAWQLKPMFQLPAPMQSSAVAPDAGDSGSETETVVPVETIRRPAPVPLPPPAPPMADAAADVAAASAARRAPVPMPSASRAANAGVAKQQPTPRAAPAPAEKAETPDTIAGAPMAAAAPAAAPAADDAPAAARAMLSVAADRAESASRERTLPDVDTDSRLTMHAWLARIRARRDAGDLGAAHASLARFRVAHPRVPVPADLQSLAD